MSKSNQNNGKRWTPQDLNTLGTLAKKNTPTPLIALKLGRTESSIRAKAQQNNVSLAPTNKSPYNRKPKN